MSTFNIMMKPHPTSVCLSTGHQIYENFTYPNAGFPKVLSQIFPRRFPKAASPTSSNLFNSVPEVKPFYRIKYLSIIIAIMYLARFTRPDVLLATSYKFYSLFAYSMKVSCNDIIN